MRVLHRLAAACVPSGSSLALQTAVLQVGDTISGFGTVEGINTLSVTSTGERRFVVNKSSNLQRAAIGPLAVDSVTGQPSLSPRASTTGRPCMSPGSGRPIRTSLEMLPWLVDIYMATKDSLEADLAAWDGRSKAKIDAIYRRHCGRVGLLSSVLQCLDSGTLEPGASWVLKRHLDEGFEPTPGQRESIYLRLPGLATWEARLHMLQCMPCMPIPESCLEQVEGFVRMCMESENRFVRAWSYTGWFELGSQYTAFRNEARELLDLGLQSESPAGKARIRQLMKRGLPD